MTVRTLSRRSKMLVRTMWRLELGCGHTAFALTSEPHQVSLVRICHAHGGYTRILSVDAFPYRISARRQPAAVKDIEVN